MKRYVVLSTNNNPDYYFFAKYAEKAWNRFGWDLIIMVTPDFDSKNIETTNKETIYIQLPDIPELRPATVAQAGRLYAAHYVGKDNLLMTCDMDLIPLSDYWNPDPKQITVYGHDLTDYSYYPMGYVAMTGHQWIEKMKLTENPKADMLRDAHETIVKGKKIAFAEDWESWWNFDWQLLTNRLKPFDWGINFIKRGRRLTGTYAYGRVDRGDGMKIPPGETLIDMHCDNHNVKHPEKMERFLKVYESIHGKI